MNHVVRSLPRTMALATAALSALTALAFAQEQPSSPHARIRGPIDESDAITLVGNTHPLAQPENDRGPVAEETRLEHMVLLLAPDAAQQKALDALTEAQQNPDSPLYHKWLTPEEFGRRFGASAADIARLTSWLTMHGFTVEPVPAGRRSILFSGTAAQVADTFHTEMHRFEVNGVLHLSNAQDPQIPRAIAPVVSGILSLNDFRRQSAIRFVRPVAAPQGELRGTQTAGVHPENSQGSTHYLFPADYATIYDLNPQYAAGKTGTGATIAIVGRSNINLSDVSSFRSYSALTANQPTVVFTGANPGLVQGDQDESTLDVEWAGAVAPGAAVTFVVGASTSTTDGVDLSAQYIVNHKTATVMSTSYGSCEANMGSGGMSFYNSLWQQAASEGISSFVSSGDSGAAGCNNGGSTTGSAAGVNGLCSSPYSTCVGGTEFNEGSNSASYWSATNGTGGGSALSYIPEKVWNESASNGGQGLWASTGGVSLSYPQPSWQVGIAGAKSNGMRAVPDVAMTASGHDGYLICENGNWYVIGGTSAASPSFAGVMAVVVENKGGTGQGNANPTLYSLLTAAQNPFHATPSGNNSVPGVNGFTASGASYNLATGLGSVDADVLVKMWPASASGGGGGNPSFTLKPSVTSASLLPGKSTTFTVALTGAGGFTGTATLTAKLPTGVTLTFNPASLQVGGTATATLAVGSSVAAQTGTITITGTSGTIAATTTVSLTVLQAPTLKLSAATSSTPLVQGKSITLPVTATTGGTFTGTVNFTVAGLPAGVTGTFSPASYTASGAGSSTTTLTLKAAATAALGSGKLTITATGDGLTATVAATMQVAQAPGMTLSFSPSSVSMKSTASQAVVVTLTPVGGAQLSASATTASFQIAGLPAGVTATWGTPSLTAAGALQAKLTLSGSKTAAVSNTTATVTAKDSDKGTAAAYSATGTIGLSLTK